MSQTEYDETPVGSHRGRPSAAAAQGQGQQQLVDGKLHPVSENAVKMQMDQQQQQLQAKEEEEGAGCCKCTVM